MKNSVVLFGLFITIMLFYACSEENLQQIEEEPHIAHTDVKRSCGKDAHMTQLLAKPDYKKAHEKRMNFFTKYSATNLNNRSSAPMTIPVAVHFQGISSPDLSCLSDMAKDAIQALNDDFQGNNSDISEWDNNASSSFSGIQNGDARIDFILANKNHPSGYGLTDGDVAVTVNTTSGDFDNKWAGYLNIFVGDAGGALGYAPLGGSGNGDGVVIDKNYFSTNRNCSGLRPTAPFDKGRTLTHEIGHYLLLDHIWGGGCGQDDLVDDTPNQNADYSGCPNIGASSCGSKDLHMNYMDYTNDECMYMFTRGQTTRSENYLASSLGSLTSNVANVIEGGVTNNTTCKSPSSVSSQNITENSARITWSAATQATGYQVQYRVQGATTFTTIASSATEADLTGLTPSRTYEYKVRTQCSSENSPFTALKLFTTQDAVQVDACDVPNSTQVTVLSDVSVIISWASVTDAIRYQLRYRIAGTNSWTRRFTSTSSRTLRGLARGTTYEYQVRTRCASGWTRYTSVDTFATGSGGESTNGITVEIVLDDFGSETTWQIVDLDDEVVISGGPYNDGQAGTIKRKTTPLDDGCYTLYVDDTYGDGICCDYGDGSFKLIDALGTVVGESNGRFGTFDYIDFCVENNEAEFRRQSKDEKVVGSSTKKINTY